MVQEKKNKRGLVKKVLLISILLLLLVIGFIWYSLLPWMANHYGFALPGEKGLPYWVMYNGRGYFNSITCANANWCEEDQKNYPNQLCMKESEIRQYGDWPLVQVSSVQTLLGDPYPVMADNYILRKPVRYGEPVYGMAVYVSRGNGCYIQYQLSGGP